MEQKTAPKYIRVYEGLKERLSSGEWSTGQRLPSEWELARQYGVAYMTVRQAVAKLVQEGILHRVRGRGTFVSETSPNSQSVLGIVLPAGWHRIDPFYFPPLVCGFVDCAAEHGYKVLTASRAEPVSEFQHLRELKVKAVACILIEQSDTEEIEALADYGLTVLAINHYSGRRRIGWVAPDNMGGMRAATRYLLELGHRDVLFLAGPDNNIDARERLRGFRTAWRDMGLTVSPRAILRGEFNEMSGYTRMKAVLKRRRLPTAIVTASDLSAIGAIRALLEAGVAVPEEVSVMGFGDFQIARYMHPALSTVRLPLDDLGSETATALIEAMHMMPSAPPRKRLPCELVLRESTAPPRQQQ